MTKYYNRDEFKELRQQLRNESPPAEKALWERLRGSQLAGQKFRRQYGIGPYVIDFYCTRAKLGIEVDGPSHYEEGAEERDKARAAYINGFGIRILRYTNSDVYENMENVLGEILRVLEIKK